MEAYLDETRGYTHALERDFCDWSSLGTLEIMIPEVTDGLTRRFCENRSSFCELLDLRARLPPDHDLLKVKLIGDPNGFLARYRLALGAQ